MAWEESGRTEECRRQVCADTRDVVAFNLVSKELIVISPNESTYARPQVGADFVLWHRAGSTTSGGIVRVGGIGVYDIQNRRISSLVNQNDVTINGVWQNIAAVSSDASVYVHDLATTSSRTISGIPPNVRLSWRLLLWAEQSNEEEFIIKAHDVLADTTFTVALVASKQAPVAYRALNGVLVWQELRNNGWDVIATRVAIPSDWPIPNGHFYTQAVTRDNPDGIGFSVTNEGGVRFWSEFQRLGGVQVVGYPISRRFVWDGFESQAFQKMVFQWRPGEGGVYAVNVLDVMHERGLDGWLRTVRATPPIADWTADTGKPWPEIMATHQALLTDPDIRATYYKADDPITLYGLPMAPIQNMGNVLVLRAQRGIIQKWLVDTPWARAGQVTIANSGDVAKEAGLLPPTALIPESPPLGH